MCSFKAGPSNRCNANNKVINNKYMTNSKLDKKRFFSWNFKLNYNLYLLKIKKN